MKLTIVTIDYNSSENTIKLLESLKNQTDKDFEIIVVDNNSDDVGKLMNYQTSETNIIYIKNDRNLGYSGGNNVGIKKALEKWEIDPAYDGASWALLLNNDTWVESSFIEHLRVDLEGKEGIIGLAIDEGTRTVYAGFIQWLKPTLKHVSENPKSEIRNPKQISNSKSQIQKVSNFDIRASNFYAIGGAMLINKAVFDRIGMLDENYFLYFEDADFSIRARKAGVPVSFFPEIKISHSVSTSTKKLGSPMLLRYHYRNALYFNWENGPWYIKLLVWPWSLIIVIKQLGKLVIKKNTEQSKAILAGVVDFYKNKMGKLHD